MKFYRCANGIRYEQSCPAGTLFDNNLKVCNWADKVSCISESGSIGYSTDSCTDAIDLTQVPGKCDSFYRCANGIRYEQSCPAGTYFDNSLKVCNWPNKVTCV